MSVMALEAADIIGASETSAATTAASRTAPVYAKGPSVKTPSVKGPSANPSKPRSTPKGRKSASILPQTKGKKSSPPASTKGWNGVVLAEFIISVIIVGASPFLIPRSNATKTAEKVSIEAGTVTLSPIFFAADDLVRLSAVSLVFFILALMANGEKSSKFAAAFGGLVTMGLLLNAARSNKSVFTTLKDIFNKKRTDNVTQSDVVGPTRNTPPGDVKGPQ